MVYRGRIWSFKVNTVPPLCFNRSSSCRKINFPKGIYYCQSPWSRMVSMCFPSFGLSWADVGYIQGCIFVLSYSSVLQHDMLFQQHPKVWELSKLPSSSHAQIPLVMMRSHPRCECSHCPHTFSIIALPLIPSSTVITLCLFLFIPLWVLFHLAHSLFF